MTIFLVIEDCGFYSDENEWIPTSEINYSLHSVVHYASTNSKQAEEKLHDILSDEELEWDTKAEIRSQLSGRLNMNVSGYYLLGSFYYIQSINIEED